MKNIDCENIDNVLTLFSIKVNCGHKTCAISISLTSKLDIKRKKV